MQRAEDFGQPLQVAVERRGGILGPRGQAKAGRDQDKNGEKGVSSMGLRDMPFQCAGSKAGQKPG